MISIRERESERANKSCDPCLVCVPIFLEISCPVSLLHKLEGSGFPPVMSMDPIGSCSSDHISNSSAQNIPPTPGQIPVNMSFTQIFSRIQGIEILFSLKTFKVIFFSFLIWCKGNERQETKEDRETRQTVLKPPQRHQQGRDL